MKYTESQIRAALTISDYHNGINNVKPDECDAAVWRLQGAPMSAILAEAYRQEHDLRRRTQGFRDATVRTSVL